MSVGSPSFSPPPWGSVQGRGSGQITSQRFQGARNSTRQSFHQNRHMLYTHVAWEGVRRAMFASRIRIWGRFFPPLASELRPFVRKSVTWTPSDTRPIQSYLALRRSIPSTRRHLREAGKDVGHTRLSGASGGREGAAGAFCTDFKKDQRGRSLQGLSAGRLAPARTFRRPLQRPRE